MLKIGEHTIFTLLAGGYQSVDFVGLGDVQLGSLRHLAKLGALVEGAAQSRLPASRIAVAQPTLELRPRLNNKKQVLFCLVFFLCWQLL